MGIAVETRLQIYEYLLVPHCTPRDLEMLNQSGHCCMHDRGPKGHIFENKYIVCKCAAKNVFPQILATNKTIFNEAVQILYENTELKVFLPDVNLKLASPSTSRLGAVIDHVPHHALGCIRRIAIVGLWAQADLLYPDVKWRSPIDEYCDIISTTFPCLKHVRLHLDQIYEPANTKPFMGVVTLPALQSVTLQTEKSQYNPGFGKTITTAIEEKAKSLGKNLKVVAEDVHEY